MSILIAVTEEKAGAITHPAPISKLYGIPFIDEIRANGAKASVGISGKYNNTEREVSESKATVDALVNVGYIDFMLSINVKAVSGNQRDSYPYAFTIKASNIVEIYADPNDANDSVIRVREDERKEDTFYTVDETIAAIVALVPTVASASGTLLSFDRTLIQAEVRTLYSADGGYGKELLPAPGVNKVYVVTNPVYQWIATGGALINADLWLYYRNENDPTFQSYINTAIFLPSTFYEVPYVFNTLADAGGLYPTDNQPIHMWASVEQTTFTGTLRVTFDYKIVDFS